MLFLTLKPCQDSVDISTSYSHEKKQQESHKENNEDEHQDLCSPFCSCACCGMVSNTIVLETQLNEPLCTKLNSNVLIYYRNLYYKEFIESIIEPPIV